MFYTEIMDSLPVNHQMIFRESRKDILISKIIHYVLNDNWPNDTTECLRPFAAKRFELSVQQNCLLWGHRVIPPTKLRQQILTSLHIGHLGVVKMKNLARSFFWWPSLDKEIESITKKCPGCANSQPNPPLSPLHPWQWPEQPWQRIHVDYAGPFMGSMFLVIVDAHTKWIEVIPTQQATSIATINILSETFARFGLCQQLVSDNGAQFTSDQFKSFMKGNGIKHILSAPYHPATNGLAERAVQSFKNAMKAAKTDKGNLHTKLSRFLFAYRNAPHSTTNESPAYLMFGRYLRSHLTMLHPSTASIVYQKQQQQANTHAQSRPRQFNIGDRVLARDYRKDKLWQYGTIHSSNGPLSYEIEISPGVYWRRHVDQIVHTSLDNRPSPSPPIEFPAVPDVPDVSTRIDHSTIGTDVPNVSAPIDDSTNGGLLGNSPRPPVEPLSSPPKKAELPHSPSLPDRQKGSNKRIYTTRSGRVVRLPNKYSC